VSLKTCWHCELGPIATYLEIFFINKSTGTMIYCFVCSRFQRCIGQLPIDIRLPADWAYPHRTLLHFTLSPSFADQLVAFQPFYTLQTRRRLVLFLKNVTGSVG
jgi:hypothetical protein